MTLKLTYKFTILLSFILFTGSIAQVPFLRTAEIPVPIQENTGFGEFIAGLDLDNDGNPEVYAVNNMKDQGGNELIPRIYKFEKNGELWDSVWGEVIRDIPQQNSWAALTWGDWDKDGKIEIIWGPSNNFSDQNTNPPRILVFEAQGNGSDKIGASSFGFEVPNAKWTITDQDNFELRPIRWLLNDIDNDGDLELIFADRSDNYRFGVVSVSTIPDNGNGSEQWTLEASGQGENLNAATIYDMAVLENNILLIHEDGSVTVIQYSNGSYNNLGNFADMVPGGSWKSASTVDIDGDGKDEVIVGGWSKPFNQIYILKFDSLNTLKSTMIADLTNYITESGRINGGHDAYGDIDGDGNLDFIFGTRGATPNASIIRLEYQGGNITEPQNYITQIIDSLYPSSDQSRFDVVGVANLDDDPELEVLYTNGNQAERIPIVILDLQKSTGTDESILPGKYILEQNYPNPFNPTTTINFALGKSSIVSLKIYNTLGELISTIIHNKFLNAGKYSITFDASELSSGVYVYRLETNKKIVSRKMILQK
ncbi:FG-GAP repeat protein [bacterium BMS3Abin04]|nr:FG-GAP repeat protein [bacterium BMS3Abin04]